MAPFIESLITRLENMWGRETTEQAPSRSAEGQNSMIITDQQKREEKRNSNLHGRKQS